MNNIIKPHYIHTWTSQLTQSFNCPDRAVTTGPAGPAIARSKLASSPTDGVREWVGVGKRDQCMRHKSRYL